MSDGSSADGSWIGSRRKVLSRFGASVVGLGLVGNVRGGRTIQVPTLENPDGPVQFERIPRSRLEQYRVASAVNRDVHEEYRGRDDFNGAGIRLSDTDGEGLSVNLRTESPRMQIESERDRVPINVERGAGPRQMCPYNTSLDRVAGGGEIWAGQFLTTAGTLAGLVERNGNEYMLTCDHVMTQTDRTPEHDDQVVGYYGTHNSEDGDWALLQTRDSEIGWREGVQVSSDATRYDPGHYDFWAWHTKYGLLSRMNDGTTTHKVGRSTGHTFSGDGILEIEYGADHGDGNTYDSNGQPQGVVHTAAIAEGDSGGPSYTVSDDRTGYMEIIGHNVSAKDRAGSTCGRESDFWDETIAMPAYSLSQDRNIDYKVELLS